VDRAGAKRITRLIPGEVTPDSWSAVAAVSSRAARVPASPRLGRRRAAEAGRSCGERFANRMRRQPTAPQVIRDRSGASGAERVSDASSWCAGGDRVGEMIDLPETAN
jgi:hypothetical protein